MKHPSRVEHLGQGLPLSTWHLHRKRIRQIHNLKGKDQSNRPPRIASAPEAQPSAQMHSRPITPADVCVILEDRIIREKRRIAELVAKVGSVDQEFTEVDMNEVNDLQRKLEEAKQGRLVEAIPGPQYACQATILLHQVILRQGRLGKVDLGPGLMSEVDLRQIKEDTLIQVIVDHQEDVRVILLWSLLQSQYQSQQWHQYSKVGQRISVPRVRLHKNQPRLFHKSFSRLEQRYLWVDLCNLLHCVE